MWTPTAALPDSQADTAYYFVVVACTNGQGCGNLASAEQAFDKLGRKAVLSAPQEGRLTGTADQVGQDGRLWGRRGGGALVRERRHPVLAGLPELRGAGLPALPGPAGGRPLDADTPLQTPGQTEARSYQVNVATDPGFQNLVDTAEVHQATYTVPWGTYPEGPLYWRVRALDGDRNLPWSDTGEFTKKSPVPVPASPTDGATVNGDTPLS